MRIQFEMKSEFGSARQFEIEGPTCIIGRSARCDIRLPLPSVAMKQVEVLINPDTVRLRCLQEGAPVTVNGERVDDAWLNDGDELSIGPVTFAVSIVADGALQSDVPAPEIETLPITLQTDTRPAANDW